MLKARVILVLALNLVIVAAEVFAGVAGHSMSLLADAVHNLGDCMGIVIALVAIIYREKRATREMTWGYVRSEMMAGFLNSVTLIAGMGLVVFGAVKRLLTPESVNGPAMIVVASAALVANLLSVFLLRGTGLAGHMHVHGHGHEDAHDHKHDHGFHHEHEHEHSGKAHGHSEGEAPDMNIRAAYLHLISDAAVSLGVILGGVGIFFLHWNWLDPVLSLVFTLLILQESVSVLRVTFLSLMDAGSENLDRIEGAILARPEILSIHDIHITRPSSRDLIFSAHLVLRENYPLETVDGILESLRGELVALGVTHSLFQPESSCFHGDDPLCCSHL
jgi:cobalt-zinc-cadmium efflux system protein